MASIGKFNTAILSVPNELTVAAANFNLDFSLMKVEAPKEFHGLRDALSSYRRREAEEGLPHMTARRLGALFDFIIPPIPHLIKAYGKRVSDISCLGTEPQSHLNGIFAAQAGPDGTNIWAAATSGKGALAVHLLACMLARIWKGHEATSLWVELVERRKQEINDSFENTNTAETATIMAAQQIFTRQQLASWDSSARSWLRTADAAKNFEQTQLMLIINNVRMPVNTNKDPYESVVRAWKSAMCATERLVQGIPQRVQDGAVLLAISSWHLYPNMEVLVDQITPIDQNDELMNGAVLTISAHGASNDKEGVFWSLPLARMRYYSPPVVAERRLASETSRISMEEFQMVILGIVIAQWGTSCSDEERCCRLIILLSNRLSQASNATVRWLAILADAANKYISSRGVQRQQFFKLLGLGMRRCNSFLNEPTSSLPHFFGLEYFYVLLDMIAGV